MKTNANKSAAGAAFPSTRHSAPARSLAAARTRLATSSAETRAASEKRLKAVAPPPARSGAKHAQKKRAKPTERIERAERSGHATRQTEAAAEREAPKAREKSTDRSARARANSSAKAATVVKVAAIKTVKGGSTPAPALAAGPAAKQASVAVPATTKTKAAKAAKSAPARSVSAATPERAAVRESTPAADASVRAPAAAVQAAVHTHETRTPPAVTPSVAPTHNGRGDATLARYMSELAGYELLGRDDEIRLAQEVERLEISYWQTLLGMPRAFEALEPVIRGKLEEPDTATDLVAVGRTVRAARAPDASKPARSRYTRAVERAATQLRALDIHREAAKAAHEAAQEFADSPQAGRSTKGGHTKAVDSYLSEIDSARRAQQMAKDRFVAANLRLVVSMARRYAREGRMPLADLIQEGNLGLMKAVERFDHRRGFRFSTYASWWIRHALTRGLADKGRLVRLPVHALETRTRLARATRKLTCRTGAAPTLAELAAETGLAPEKLTAVEELSTEAPFSLDAPVGGDNDRTFLDMLRYEDQTSAEDSVVSESHKESLSSLMGELSPFEAQILRYRYGFDGGEERTLKEIGQMYNLSRERIRQIQACALAKMRARVEDADQERAAL
jgi:RNA polymerase primary sigma factor